MKRNDWIGLLTSLVIHALVLLLLAFKHVQLTQVPPLGFIEVELGPWAEGRPVQQSEQPRPNEAAPEPQPETPQEETAALPEKTRPVELPETPPVQEEERINEPEETRVAPEPQNNPAEVKKPEAGAATGNEGEGQEDQRSAPYLIEGLDRTLVQAPLPVYAEKVNAIIRVRIVVDPQGRVVQAIPLLKGNPALERAVLEALRRWRFNPLPPGVPPENQTGTITFRFRLE